jgi:hypothetical protein
MPIQYRYTVQIMYSLREQRIQGKQREQREQGEQRKQG